MVYPDVGTEAPGAGQETRVTTHNVSHQCGIQIVGGQQGVERPLGEGPLLPAPVVDGDFPVMDEMNSMNSSEAPCNGWGRSRRVNESCPPPGCCAGLRGWRTGTWSGRCGGSRRQSLGQFGETDGHWILEIRSALKVSRISGRFSVHDPGKRRTNQKRMFVRGD